MEDIAFSISNAVTAALVDMDGSENLSSFVLSNIPIGHTISDGVNTFTSSSGLQVIDINSWNFSALSYLGTSPGVFPIDVLVETTDDDGFTVASDTAETLDSFIVTILSKDTDCDNLEPIQFKICLLYTSPSPRDATLSRMPSSA